MAQVINTNVAALQARSGLDRNQTRLNVALERLSSGKRINTARDDAAGLAISERMTSQVRGLNQSRRNINDAVSLVQTSEGALSEMTNLFQRGRELAVQAANVTNSYADRAAMQAEVTQLVREVDRISSTQDFNGVKLFDGGSRTVNYASGSTPTPLTSTQKELVGYLQQSWLQQGEKVLNDYFGIQGDGSPLVINFVEGQSYLAAVSMSGFNSVSGRAANVAMHLDLENFTPSGGINGGPSFVSNDRIVLHELTHATMAKTINMRDMPHWFIEGTAEFMAGADERLAGDMAWQPGATTADKVANLMNNHLTTGEVASYSAGYAAVGYLHKSIRDAGGTGMREVFDYLQANIGSDLDDAIVAMKAAHSSLAYGNLSQFQGMFDVGDAGNTYLVNRITSGQLTNGDTGAIGGADADGGTRDTTRNGTVPDTPNPTSDPMVGFEEIWPTNTPNAIALQSVGTLAFQVGANIGETINIDRVAINAGNLGIANANLNVDAELAIIQFDRAIQAVSNERARLGALSNRLESASNALDISIENVSAARSRITDADFAQETAQLVKHQILQQAGTSILTQANQLPQNVLSLLQ